MTEDSTGGTGNVGNPNTPPQESKPSTSPAADVRLPNALSQPAAAPSIPPIPPLPLPVPPVVPTPTSPLATGRTPSTPANLPPQMPQKQAPPLTSLGMGAFSVDPSPPPTPKSPEKPPTSPPPRSWGTPPPSTIGVSQNLEPHILNETIIRPATKVSAPASIVGQPPPKPPVAAPAPLAPPDIPPFPRPMPGAAPISPAAAPPPGQAAQTTTPQGPADFSRVLEEIKLPERRDFRARADTKTSTPPPSQPSVPSSTPPAGPPVTLRPPVENAGIVKTVTESASSIVTPLRTLKNDLQDIVRSRKISTVRAAALDQGKLYGSAPHAAPLAHPRAKRAFGMLYIALIFVILGIAAFIGVFLFMQSQSVPAPQSPYPSILFAESIVSIPGDELSDIEFKRALAQQRISTSATLGSISRIIPTIQTTSTGGTSADETMSFKDFLKTIDASVSEDLLQSLEATFFLGIHVSDRNAPMFVVPVSDYERAFAGMLMWERTMNDDLAPLFTAIPDQVLGSGGLLEKRKFTDLVLQNYDVRALKNDAGEVQLYYSFPNRNLLIIAENPFSFNEVLLRLRAERKL